VGAKRRRLEKGEFHIYLISNKKCLQGKTLK
jgi:hypothetical protein